MTETVPNIASDSSLRLNSRVAVVAAGRLGASLTVALARAGRNVVAVSSRRDTQRRWLNTQLAAVASIRDDSEGRTRVCSEPRDAASDAEVIFVTSSDAAISTVARSCEVRRGQYVVHCSGLLGVDILATAAPEATPGAMHPLQTFPSRECHYLIDGISFGIESPDDALREWLTELAATFNGRVVHVSGESQRAAYHAAAVMSCGLFAGLAGVAAELWRELGVNRDDALSHMAPMIRSTAAAISEMGIPDAISGPFVRGDTDTIRAHLTATHGFSRDVGRAYAALALAQLHLAGEKGNLKPDTVAEMRRILTDHLEAQ